MYELRTRTCREHLIDVLQSARPVHCCHQMQQHVNSFWFPAKFWADGSTATGEVTSTSLYQLPTPAITRQTLVVAVEVKTETMQFRCAESTDPAAVLVQGEGGRAGQPCRMGNVRRKRQEVEGESEIQRSAEPAEGSFSICILADMEDLRRNSTDHEMEETKKKKMEIMMMTILFFIRGKR